MQSEADHLIVAAMVTVEIHSPIAVAITTFVPAWLRSCVSISVYADIGFPTLTFLTSYHHHLNNLNSISTKSFDLPAMSTIEQSASAVCDDCKETIKGGKKALRSHMLQKHKLEYKCTILGKQLFNPRSR